MKIGDRVVLNRDKAKPSPADESGRGGIGIVQELGGLVLVLWRNGLHWEDADTLIPFKEEEHASEPIPAAPPPPPAAVHAAE